MKQYIYTITVFIFLLFICAHKTAMGVRLYSNTGKYLGNVNTNSFDKDSVNNPFGKYGSPFSPDSVKNPFSAYGSPFGSDSILKNNVPNNIIQPLNNFNN